MKKLTLSFVAFSALLGASSVMAVDSTGCGLGSRAWQGESGRIPQILAVTTNGFFGNQTFGISSGTSGCDPNGTISGGKQGRMLSFLENNMEQFALDASRGKGETLATIAGILEVDEAKVAHVAKANFDALFPTENTEVLHVASTMLDLLDIPQA